MRFNTRLWSAGRLFAIAACLVATYLLFAVTAMRVAFRVREVPVPDLRNHTVAEATAMLQEPDLALTVDESGRLDPKVPAGRIAHAGTCPWSDHPAATQHSRVDEPGPENHGDSDADR